MTFERIMIVEDEAVTAMALKVSLTSLGYNVVASVPSGEEAVVAARRTHLDVVLMDIRLKGKMDGVTTAETIRKETNVPSIYLTANSDQETLQRAKIAEPYGYLLKPYNEKELRAAIEIALHMSAMERDRRAAEQALESREKLLQDITDNSPAIIYTKDRDGRYTLVNRMFETTFGKTRSSIRGRDDHEVFPGKLRDVLWSADEAVLQEGTPTQEEEEIPHGDSPRAYIATRFPLRTPQGAVHGVCGILTDITELKRTEEALRESEERYHKLAESSGNAIKQAKDEISQLKGDLEGRVAERTRSLELANEQLESFNRTVSHDLRAPVRGIEDLTAALAGGAAERFSSDDAELVKRIRGQSRKLGELLTDLMAFSQGTHDQVERHPIDISALSREVVADLRGDDPRRNVDIVIADPLTCDGDGLLVQLVLANLIGNAWKYTSKTPAARIEVGSEKQADGVTAIFVKDNGAGFDMNAASRLFQPFQRLHAREFPGTGLGLSSVKRIIERHGGRVWASGKVGEGATFWFAI